MAIDDFFRRAIEGSTFSFTQRPEPVAGDLRMSWGIGILLLSLFYSQGKKCSFQKLQFLAHSVRTPEGRDDVRRVMVGELSVSDVSVRIEPWLNRAVSYAHGLGFVLVTKGKAVSLSDMGKEVASALDIDSEVFKEERVFLRETAKNLSEVKLAKIWRMENFL